jgi:hypothetical protein
MLVAPYHELSNLTQRFNDEAFVALVDRRILYQCQVEAPVSVCEKGMFE